MQTPFFNMDITNFLRVLVDVVATSFVALAISIIWFFIIYRKEILKLMSKVCIVFKLLVKKLKLLYLKALKLISKNRDKIDKLQDKIDNLIKQIEGGN